MTTAINLEEEINDVVWGIRQAREFVNRKMYALAGGILIGVRKHYDVHVFRKIMATADDESELYPYIRFFNNTFEAANLMLEEARGATA